MPKRRCVVLLLIVASACGGSSTVSTKSEIHLGVGSQSCGEWLAARDESKQGTERVTVVGMDTSWLQGFLVGQAMSRITTTRTMSSLRNVPDAESVQSWVDKYCREHRLDSLYIAGLHLRDEIEKK